MPTKPKAKPQDRMLHKTVYSSSSYQPQMSRTEDDHKFSPMPTKKKVLTKLPYFSYSMPAKTNAHAKVLLLTSFEEIDPSD